MQGATAFIDVLAVWRNVDEGRLNSEAAKQFWRLGRGGSVGAIYQHSQLAQIGVNILPKGLDVGMAQVRLAGQGWFRNFERSVIGGGRILQESENFFFDGKFARVGQLETIARKNFDPVV